MNSKSLGKSVEPVVLAMMKTDEFVYSHYFAMSCLHRSDVNR